MKFKTGLAWLAAIVVVGLVGCTLIPAVVSDIEPAVSVPSPTTVPSPTATRSLVQAPTETVVPKATATRSASPPVGLAVGHMAPDFALESLTGETMRLSDMRGQVVMVNFWAVWCGYCRIELPAMQAVHELYQDRGFVVLAVNVQESKEKVQSFVQEAGLTFPVLLDQRAEVTLMYRIRGLPTSIFIDGDGVIAALHLGPVNEQIIEEYVAQVGVE